MDLDWQYYHWHLELSSKCPLKCPRCPRIEYPDVSWLNTDMTLSLLQKFLTPDMLKSKVKRLTMCGDVGDPIYCKEFLEICKYIKTENRDIHIFIVTNGSYKKAEWWTELGTILNERDSINFSIDGYDQDSNNIYRVNSDFDSIITGLTTLRKTNHQVFINWATIVFSFNEQHLPEMQQYAKYLGCDAFQLTKSTKFGSKYGCWGGANDELEPSLQWVSSSHRYERSVIDLSGRIQDRSDFLEHGNKRFEIIRSEYKDKPITPLCAIGNRGIYVNAVGNVYPCSWMSFPYVDQTYENGKKIKYTESFFYKYLNYFNLHRRSLDEILSDPLWGKCYENFNNPNKAWVECLQKCSTSVVTKDYAVGWETN